jgi:hypothetical protein
MKIGLSTATPKLMKAAWPWITLEPRVADEFANNRKWSGKIRDRVMIT